MLLAVGCLALGGLTGYLLPHRSSSSRNPDAINPQKVVTPFTAADQNDLDAAYTARRDGRFAEAEEGFLTVAHNHPAWTSVEIELARTMVYQANFNGARVALNSIAKGNLVSSEANLLTGVTYTAQKAYRDAEASFAKAVAADPTRADVYYFWGECLRDEGKSLAAIDKFRSALLRNQYETETGLYRLKWWLSEIEVNKDEADGIDKDIDASLAGPYPAMEALFAAAAHALKAGDAQAAAAQLSRARQRVDPAVFTVILNDPLFAVALTKPEVASLLRSTSTDRPKPNSTLR